MPALKRVAEVGYEDNLLAEVVVFMERNSRYFVSRIERMNKNAEAICNVLNNHPFVKTVYYPRHNLTRCDYDACKTPNGVMVVFFLSLSEPQLGLQHSSTE